VIGVPPSYIACDHVTVARALPGVAVTRTGAPGAIGSTMAWMRPIVALPPFANQSADPENEYLTDGIADEIISALTKIQSLRVASRTSAFAFKGKNEDISEIGHKLKVSTVLEGSVRRHANKLRVTAHIYTLDDAKGLLRAGLDGFAHTVRDKDIDDEFVGLAKKQKGLFYVPNLPDSGVKTDLSWLSGSVSAQELQKLQAGASTDRPDVQKLFGIQARNLARMNKEGFFIAMGTDGGVPWAHHLEMADMVTAGMTPAQVITASTRNPAQLLRLDDLGTIAPGKSADFIVLDANPLDNIVNTRRINKVYLRGAEVDRAGMRARWQAKWNRASETR